MKHFEKVLIIVVIVVTAFPSFVRADWREFVPRVYDSGADLEFGGSYESDYSKAGSNVVKWKDIYMKERLTLNMVGYSYDPKFIQFQLSIGGGFNQEYYTVSGEPTAGWHIGLAPEYNFLMIVLPDHPYNLKLFTYRIEPLVQSKSLGVESAAVGTSTGALFEYKKKPYFFHMKYITTSVGTSVGSSDSSSFSVDGLYFKQYSKERSLSLSGEYTHSVFSSSSGVNGNSDSFTFTNGVEYMIAGLNSSLSKSIYEQETSTGLLKNDSFGWNEALHASLPLHFGTTLAWNYSKDTSNLSGSAVSENLSSTSKGVEFGITHRLYQSLDSQYLFSHTTASSFGGDTIQTSHSLLANYVKAIPWGRLLAGASVGMTVLDNRGQTAIVNEPHLATPVPGSFFLASQNADPATLQVFLKSPLPPNELILLDQNVDYTVTTVNNTLQITIFTLPSQFILPGTFDFFVSYSLTSADFKSQVDFFSYNVSLDLFNNLLNPYYNYTVSRSKLLAGSLPEGVAPLDTTSQSMGLIVHKDPFRLLGEYQSVSSNENPYKAWKAELTYDQRVTEDTRIYAIAGYEVRNYPQGTSVQSGTGYSDKTLSASSNILRQFPSKGLILTAGGSYTSVKSLTSSTAYSANASLSWRIGKVTLSLGGSASVATSEGTTLLMSRRIHQYYYLTMKRKLF